MDKYHCIICKRGFDREWKLRRHLVKKLPCDLRCKMCGYISNNERSFYNHRKKCQEEHEQKSSSQLTNNTNNIDGSTTNNNVDCSSNKSFNNNNQNIVMLQPFDVDHYYMKKGGSIGQKRDHVVGLLKDERYADAYEVLFKQIHGNHETPQHHNIYLANIEDPHLAIFRGLDFVLEKTEISLPRLLSRLKFEMGWLVKTCDYLNDKEKDQLLWDIQANWMCINETNDPNIRRLLRNNKNVVMKTMKNNIVKSDVEMIKKWVGMKDSEFQGQPGIPTPQIIESWIDENYEEADENHIVQLP